MTADNFIERALSVILVIGMESPACSLVHDLDLVVALDVPA